MDTNLDLCKEAREIKKFARFHLVHITKHARERFEERGFDIKETMSTLRHDCRIDSFRESDEGIVFNVRLKKDIIIVVAKNVSQNTCGVRYELVTIFREGEQKSGN